MNGTRLLLTGEGPAVSIEVMTPERAARLLQDPYRHRPLSNKRINRYAKIMHRGEWKFVGKAVVIDENGHIRNGTHRLSACERADVPFLTVLVQGIPVSEFE